MTMVSQQLAQQWRVRLAEWQQRLDQGRSRPWLAKAYVRVLSFLLKQYVPDDSALAAVSSRMVEDPTKPDRSAMRFIAATPDVSGKAPRSRDDIRSVLEAVRTKVPRVEAGPLSGGLHADDPIVIAAFYHPGLAAGVRQDLQAEGIVAELKSFSRQTQLIVRAGDLERAKTIVAAHAAFFRDSSRSRVQYAALYSSSGAIFGVVLGWALGIAVGAAMGYLSGVFFWAFVFSVLFAPTLWLVGLIVGTIADG